MNSTWSRVPVAAATRQTAERSMRGYFWQRVEARVVRFWGAGRLPLARYFLAVFFLGMAAMALLTSHHNQAGAPFSYWAQVLSIASVGRLSVAIAPLVVGGFEIVCAITLLLFPAARTTLILLFGRLVLGMAPLLMLRDDLRPTTITLTTAGWGVALALLPVLWALGVAFQCRWNAIGGLPETAYYLKESEAQTRARQRAWRRALVVAAPLAVAGFMGGRVAWPHYLVWFHTRQESATLNEDLAGKLIRNSMPASLLLGGRKITTWVYLPPGYETSTERYPVVYVLHGMPGEVRDCFVKGRVQDDAEQLIQSHQVHPFILVGWDAEGPGGPTDVTNYLDRPGYPMESFITRELVPYIDRTYRTIPEAGARALDGISAGGYGAANLMLKYPNLFKIAASHNGFFWPGDDSDNMTQILGPKSVAWAENDPTQLLDERLPADDLHFYGDIGDGDDLQSEFVNFGKKLSSRGIENEMHIFPGRHTWEFWSQHFNDSFRFEDKWFRALETPQETSRFR